MEQMEPLSARLPSSEATRVVLVNFYFKFGAKSNNKKSVLIAPSRDKPAGVSPSDSDERGSNSACTSLPALQFFGFQGERGYWVR